VSSRQLIPADLVARFRSGRMCLDFGHTIEDPYMSELVHGIDDLEWWLAAITDVDQISGTEHDLEPAISLRAAIRRCAERVVAGQPLTHHPIGVINSIAAGPSLVPRLTASGVSVLGAGSAAQALSTIARDAIDLFSSDIAGRLRVCAGHHCGLLVLDTSRPNRRRWCSMELCGNRAKIHTYRSRLALGAGES
jgi:predicted RNA-binding Zn ribbon-like protein